MRITVGIRFALTLFAILNHASSEIINGTTHPLPADLNGSNFTYSHPVNLFTFQSQNQSLEMAFMDIPPTSPPNNRTALLLHGKNFCAPTWSATASALASAGYRVILPDQIGFCKSSKPARYQFTFQQLALNTRSLFLLYAVNVTQLVLVNPLGLEDWKAKGVPYQSVDATFVTERASNYSSIRAYEQATYYVNEWRPEYDVWVYMLDAVYHGSQGVEFAWCQALVTDMVITQPVVYEFGLVSTRTLLVVGAKDNTAIGKQWSPPEVQARLGHYDVLGKEVAGMLRDGTLVEFEDLGHSPQVQAPDRFHSALLGWLRE
ncbi:alpha/beta-hydrolase [Polyplosphaeria fusca]|uniref:Alpha/beta-hydrolase n=1 Tax=Polyplosphaeria fusca TaxID=682080 RepID=A0A9P4UXG3_9PLEO|nr:alpha/beta-hydrolase [Polyplosphaeria fusca]